MWYKFNPYEGSIRVPLLVSAPGFVSGVKDPSLVSLVDLLPTFLDLATDGKPPQPIDPIDGRSLVPLLKGQSDGWQNEVMVEFTAEGTFVPALILRKGAYKFVYCENDPGMMYDLENDPHELNNLCEDPAHGDLAEKMRREVLQRWDPMTLKKDIIASQQRRHFLQKTMQAGAAPMWDFQPHWDASKQYLRSGNSSTHVKGLARFPFVSPKPPDHPRDV